MATARVEVCEGGDNASYLITANAVYRIDMFTYKYVFLIMACCCQFVYVGVALG